MEVSCSKKEKEAVAKVKPSQGSHSFALELPLQGDVKVEFADEDSIGAVRRG